MPGPSSAHLQDDDVRRRRRPRPSVTVTARRGRRVRERVGDEVADHLAQPRLVAEHHRHLGERVVEAQADRPVGLHRRGVVHGVAGDLGEVDRRDGRAAAAGRAGRAAAGPRRAAPCGRPRPRCAASAGSRPRASLTAPCRYSSAKPRIEVSGVRSSWLASATKRRIRSAEPRALLLGLLLRAERALDPGEHAVERGRQPADLGALVALGHALGEVAGGDRLRRPLHLAERAQAVAHQHVPGAAEQRRGRRDRRPARCATSRPMASSSPSMSIADDERVAVGQPPGRRPATSCRRRRTDTVTGLGRRGGRSAAHGVHVGQPLVRPPGRRATTRRAAPARSRGRRPVSPPYCATETASAGRRDLSRPGGPWPSARRPAGPAGSPSSSDGRGDAGGRQRRPPPGRPAGATRRDPQRDPLGRVPEVPGGTRHAPRGRRSV